jgi:hypothetical protein
LWVDLIYLPKWSTLGAPTVRLLPYSQMLN